MGPLVSMPTIPCFMARGCKGLGSAASQKRMDESAQIIYLYCLQQNKKDSALLDRVGQQGGLHQAQRQVHKAWMSAGRTALRIDFTIITDIHLICF